MTYLAARYPTFNIGSLVLGQAYRNPALLAKMAATLQLLTDGRLVLGIGAGWLEEEYRSYGYGFPAAGERVEQLVEAIDIIRLLWTGETVSYAGKHYSITDARCLPAPKIAIPLHVGSAGPKVVGIAARKADGWNWHATPDMYDAPFDVLKKVCADTCRRLDDIELTGGVYAQFPQRNADFMRGHAVGPTPEAAIEALRPYVQQGVRHFQVSAANMHSLTLFAQQVAPALKDISRTAVPGA